MTPERLLEIRQFINKYGPANCWSGTLGTACGMLHELLQELESVQRELCSYQLGRIGEEFVAGMGEIVDER